MSSAKPYEPKSETQWVSPGQTAFEGLWEILDKPVTADMLKAKFPHYATTPSNT